VLDGQRFLAFNGGPHFSFSEGVSFFVSCETQADVDYYWDHLLANGGVESQCGWLRDRFGLSWQIIPTTLQQLLRNPDRAVAERAVQAMLKMQKIIIEDLQKAALV
jgi:predicted 3-demethylubiquinone-9 3-methyltransferase (glyoxalase superfamily)